MQVSVEDLGSVKKKLHIEIPEEEVTRELDEAYKKLNKTAKVRGFRPGKVPRSVLERLYKKNVNAEISSKLIQESFEAAIKETNLAYLGQPQIDPPEPKAKHPYKYDVTIELNPEISDIDYKGITLKKPLYNVSDEAVEAQLKNIQRIAKEQKPLEEDRALREDDIAVIDFEGFKDGQPFAEAQKTENYVMKVGRSQIIKEFDEKLVGMTPKETREISVRFPESYLNPNIANLELTFQVTLKEIREEFLPEINDELANRLGKENLEELKKQVISDLNQGYEKRIEQELNEQIFQEILSRQDFEVPDIMVEYELDGIIREVENSFTYQGTTMEEQGVTREMLVEKYRDTAVNQLKRRLILNKLVEQENMTVSDEEVEIGLKEMAESLNKTPAELRNYYKQNNAEFEYFKHALLEKQAIRLVIENSIIEEVVVSQ